MMASYRSMWMARRNCIHIHCTRLKWNEGAFNNHGSMVFKESWDTGKRRIENERLQRLLACTPTSGHMTSRHTPPHTLARKLCCIYIWMLICKSVVRNSPYATILSSNFRFTSINEFISPGSMVLDVCMILNGLSEVINYFSQVNSVGRNIDLGIHGRWKTTAVSIGKEWKIYWKVKNKISDNSH